MSEPVSATATRPALVLSARGDGARPSAGRLLATVGGVSHPEPLGICPHCGGPSPRQTPRYVDAICDSCQDRLVDVHGRPVAAYNESLLGTGLVVLHKDDEARCESSSADGRVFIDGRPYRGAEARFGGVVVRPLPE